MPNPCLEQDTAMKLRNVNFPKLSRNLSRCSSFLAAGITADEGVRARDTEKNKDTRGITSGYCFPHGGNCVIFAVGWEFPMDYVC